MGKVIEKVRVRNFTDIFRFKEGLISEDKIISVELEAIVDTGAAYLCLPSENIEKLGLIYSFSREVKTANGKVERRIFSAAEITIKDRTINMDIMENDNTTPPLIGYLVLQTMDFVVDPGSEKILGNPEHDGKWIMDLY